MNSDRYETSSKMHALTKLFDDEPLDHPDGSPMLTLDEKSIHVEPNVMESQSQSSETEEQALKKSAKNYSIHSMMNDNFEHFDYYFDHFEYYFDYYFDYLCFKIQEIIYIIMMLLLPCNILFNKYEERYEMEHVDLADLEEIFDEQENKEEQATLETKYSNSTESLLSRRSSSSDELDFVIVSLSDAEDFAN